MDMVNTDVHLSAGCRVAFGVGELVLPDSVDEIWGVIVSGQHILDGVCVHLISSFMCYIHLLIFSISCLLLYFIFIPVDYHKLSFSIYLCLTFRSSSVFLTLNLPFSRYLTTFIGLFFFFLTFSLNLLESLCSNLSLFVFLLFSLFVCHSLVPRHFLFIHSTF